jgi:hypothetical protein
MSSEPVYDRSVGSYSVEASFVGEGVKQIAFA